MVPSSSSSLIEKQRELDLGDEARYEGMDVLANDTDADPEVFLSVNG